MFFVGSAGGNIKHNLQAGTGSGISAPRPGFDPSSAHVTLNGGHSGTLADFSCCSSVFPVSVIPPTGVTHAVCCSYKDKWAKPGNFTNKHSSRSHKFRPYIEPSTRKLPPEETDSNRADLKQGNSGHKCCTAGLPRLEMSTAKHVRKWWQCVNSCSCSHTQFVMIISEKFYTWRKMGRREDQKGPHTKFGQNQSNGKVEVVLAHAT